MHRMMAEMVQSASEWYGITLTILETIALMIVIVLQNIATYVNRIKRRQYLYFSTCILTTCYRHFWHGYAPNNGGNCPSCFRLCDNYADSGDYRFDDRDCATEFQYICENN